MARPAAHSHAGLWGVRSLGVGEASRERDRLRTPSRMGHNQCLRPGTSHRGGTLSPWRSVAVTDPQREEFHGFGRGKRSMYVRYHYCRTPRSCNWMNDISTVGTLCILGSASLGLILDQYLGPRDRATTVRATTEY